MAQGVVHDSSSRRIVSLVPSLTEALFAFGVGDKLVGRTRYCTQPPRAVGKVAKVGGTKKVDVARLLELEPDLIVAVREENTREGDTRKGPARNTCIIVPYMVLLHHVARR